MSATLRWMTGMVFWLCGVLLVTGICLAGSVSSGSGGGGGGGGDAYNTITDGVNSCSASGSTQLEIPGAFLTCGNPTKAIASRQTMWFGCDDVVTTTVTYLQAGHSTSTGCASSDTTVNAILRIPMTSAYRIRKIFCLSTTPGAGVTHTFVPRIDGVNTSMSCAIVNPAASCTSTANPTTGAANTGLSVEMTDSSTNDTGAVRCAIEVTWE